MNRQRKINCMTFTEREIERAGEGGKEERERLWKEGANEKERLKGGKVK